MFNLFKKKPKNEPVKIYAPIDGVCVEIEKVPDDVFSEKMMGDGVAIEPTGDMLCAPIDGKISAIIDSHHAFGITSDEGIEVLVHCGLETVNLQGEGFTVLKSVNDVVKVGDPIIQIDKKYMEEHQIPLITPVVILNQAEKEITKRATGEVVKTKENSILELS